MDLKAKLARLTSAGPGSRPTPAAEPALFSPNTFDPLGPNEVEGYPAARPPCAEGEPASHAPPGASDRAARIRSRLAALSSRLPPGRAPKAPTRPLPGALRDTARGPVHLVEVFLPAEHRHGDAPVAAALRADPALVARLALDDGLRGTDMRRLLLLDTETTGLAGGTGTLAFLVGLGWFDEGRLRLEQLFLRRPGEEGPMLSRLAEALTRSSLLVTYNGKSFDWPLLRNRFVMNRLPVPRPPPHVDLLHCARRVFRRRLAQLRLACVESEVLGHQRHGDVDGAEIPELYFEYLRGGDGSALAQVAEHNAQDLIALAALLGSLVERFAAAASGGDARDNLGFAEVARRSHDRTRALAFAQAAAASASAGGSLAADALALVARLSNGRGDGAGAARALEEALRHVSPADARAATLHLALAKVLEHRLREPTRALAHALAGKAAESPSDHARRRRRLEHSMEVCEKNRTLALTASRDT